MHAFRAFAIVNITAIHAIEFVFFFAETSEHPAKPNLTPFAWGESILLHDSTLYFTIISGMLFSMVLVDRGYASFFKSKLAYVIAPYLFFTTLITWRGWGLDGTLKMFDGDLLNFLTLVFNNFFTGAAIFSFWYIPVLLVLYVLTPALAKIVKLEWGKWLFIPILLAPLVCSRAWPDVTWTNFVYFLGAYMLGIIAGINYKKTIAVIERYLLLLALVAIGSTAALVGLFYLDSPKWGIITFTESAWYIQKIAFSALVILLFERTIHYIPKWLDLLGNYAFAIYFLHAYLLFEMYAVMEKLMDVPISLPIILTLALLNVGLVILFSLIITYICKLILGKWSRYFVGA
ncbi:acyltransferase family protein [Thalassomonas sp. M1454]|uniref:acyltransferase family protein n=1 Tax=Thalassomonas sp. M1454 TaxID=2594477 RepID=UPI0021B0DE7C|nr:acyltransferase family protein [Thalassomonas sp. M1454]